MRKVVGLVLPLAAAAMIGGCATGYKSNGFMGGFSEVQLAENVFKVNFRGNGFTSEERAREMALLRGAELAITHGYPFFVIQDSRTDVKYSAVALPQQTTTNAQVTAIGNTAYGSSTSTTYGGGVDIVERPLATHTIIMLKEKPAIGMAYDAAIICKSLGSKHGADCAQKATQ